MTHCDAASICIERRRFTWRCEESQSAWAVIQNETMGAFDVEASALRWFLRPVELAELPSGLLESPLDITDVTLDSHRFWRLPAALYHHLSNFGADRSRYVL